MQNFKYQAAVLLRLLANIAAQKGLTHQDIADKTGFDRPNVTRMLNAHYMPSLNNFLKLAEVIGIYFTAEDKEDNSDMAKALEEALDYLRPKDFN